MVSRPLRTDFATFSDIGSRRLNASGVISLEQETIFRSSMRLSVMDFQLSGVVHEPAILRENYVQEEGNYPASDKCLSGSQFSRGQGIIVNSIILMNEALP